MFEAVSVNLPPPPPPSAATPLSEPVYAYIVMTSPALVAPFTSSPLLKTSPALIAENTYKNESGIFLKKKLKK